MKQMTPVTLILKREGNASHLHNRILASLLGLSWAASLLETLGRGS